MTNDITDILNKFEENDNLVVATLDEKTVRILLQFMTQAPVYAEAIVNLMNWCINKEYRINIEEFK